MGFGERLRAARIRAGLSVYELSARTGVSQSAISGYEAGERQPLLPTAQLLAAGVGEYLEELAGPLPELPEYTPPRRGRRRRPKEESDPVPQGHAT